MSEHNSSRGSRAIWAGSMAGTSECLTMLKGQPAFPARPNRASVQSTAGFSVHAQLKIL